MVEAAGRRQPRPGFPAPRAEWALEHEDLVLIRQQMCECCRIIQEKQADEVIRQHRVRAGLVDVVHVLQLVLDAPRADQAVS